jgi:transposase-like protein
MSYFMSAHVFKRSQRDYPLTFKLAVVKSVESGRFTYCQAQKHYGIQGSATVLVWLRKHGTLNWNSAKLLIMSSPDLQKTPEQRIRELEAELEDERGKVLFLKSAIKIAEQQYGLQFKKKSSSKQPRNSKKKKN